MPQKRASVGDVRDGRQSGGEYLPSKIADPIPILNSNGLGLVDIVSEVDNTPEDDWTETSARISGRVVKWRKHKDGTVTSNKSDKMTYLMLERMNDRSYWMEVAQLGTTRPNRSAVDVWGGAILADLLEDGYIDTVLRDGKISGTQNCLAACHSLNNLSDERLGRHRLSAALARSRTATFFYNMSGDESQHMKLNGCVIRKDNRSSPSLRRITSDIYFAEANLRDCLTEWDTSRHRTEVINDAYNGRNNDLIWKLLVEKVPHRNVVQREDVESALRCALLQTKTSREIGRSGVTSSQRNTSRLVADGCIESDEVAAEVLRWLEPDREVVEWSVNGLNVVEDVDIQRRNFIEGVWRILSEADFPSHFKKCDTDYYQGDRRRRLMQIFSAGLKLNTTSLEIPQDCVPSYNEPDQGVNAYLNARTVFNFRMWMRKVDKFTPILCEAEANSWGNDKYTAKAIECNKAMLQQVYEKAPSELRQYIPNARSSSFEDLRSDQHATEHKHHRSIHPERTESNT